MQSLLVASAFAAASATDSFATWSKNFGRTYASKDEVTLRRSIYAANVAKIEAHNARAAAGQVSWTMGVNQFTDLLAEEFKARYTGGLRASQHRSQNVVDLSIGAAAPPASVDWEAAGAVTPVKDQGQCGSCWAFSTTGGVEGTTAVTGGTPVGLSEQQLVDCSGAEGNQGCNGGLMDDAFQYIIDNKGITSDTQYPYKAVDGTCNKAVTVVATIKSFTDVKVNSEDALIAAIVQQPISVAVEADQASFQSYQSGVMTAACGTNLDHGVLAVGYGTQGGQDYYKVKNSWGASWGDKGYIYLGRGAAFNPAGQCGIQMMASYPTA